MSHYSSTGSGGGSWQSHTNSSASGNSSSHHDKGQSSSSSYSQSNAAANLLAQIASGSVNLNNLAANLPALVNSNVLQTLGSSSSSQMGLYGSGSSEPRPMTDFDALARSLAAGNSSGGSGSSSATSKNSGGSSNSGGGSNRYNNNNNGGASNSRYSQSGNSSSSSSAPSQQSMGAQPAPVLAQALLNQLAAVQSSSNASSSSVLSAAVALMRKNQPTSNNPPQQQQQQHNQHQKHQQKNSHNQSLNAPQNRQSQQHQQQQHQKQQKRSRSTNRNDNDRSTAVRTRNASPTSSGSNDRRLVIDESSGKPQHQQHQQGKPFSNPGNKNKNNNNSGNQNNQGFNKQQQQQQNKQKPFDKKSESVSSSGSGFGKRNSPSRSPSSKRFGSTFSHGSSSSNAGGYHQTKSSSALQKYSVHVPKYSLDCLNNNVAGLKGRYSELYVPSDFTNVKNSWQSSLPVNRSLKFTSRCLFHIMKKEASPLQPIATPVDPPDANHTWNVKVMLLAMPNVQELIKRCCNLTEDGQKDERHEHPSKVIQFLVGSKSKQELMAIGGPWSPSLDGENPAQNTQTLINTAIRTTKALTGIDLSPCTQWYRFLELQYNRSQDFKTNVAARVAKEESVASETEKSEQKSETAEETSETKAAAESAQKSFDLSVNVNDESYVENTVIFLPNVWSLMPNSAEYQKIVEAYKNFIDHPPEEASAAGAEVVKEKPSETPTQSKVKEEPVEQPKKETQEAPSTSTPTSEAKEPSEGEKKPESSQPVKAAHELPADLKTLKVDELRHELETRNLDTKGTKAVLINRLNESLEKEKEKASVGQEMDTIEPELVVDVKDEDEELNNQSNGSGNFMDAVTINGEDMQLDLGEKAKPAEQDQEAAKKPTGAESSGAPSQESEAKSKEARAERERLYRLPGTPHIVVHPSTSAKAGKFECQLVSLSHLLDYDRKNNRESSFEVSLFAEYFNEMLMRDHLFLIYKHLLALPSEKSKEQMSQLLSNKRKLSSEHSPGTGAGELEAKRAKQEDAPARKDAASDDQTKEKTSMAPPPPAAAAGGGASKGKMKTVNPELLLAFLYFDYNRAGYLHERDVENLLLCMGLSLTRSKVKSLLTRAPLKENLLSYRVLTDLPLELAASYRNSLTTSSSLTEPLSLNGRSVELNVKLPGDDEFASAVLSYDSYVSRAGRVGGKETSSTVKREASASGLVEVDGISVDVPRTLKRLETSELRTLELESKLRELRSELDRARSLNKNLEKAKLKQFDEINDLKKSLKESGRQLRESEEKFSKAKDLIGRSRSQVGKVYDELGDFIKRTTVPPPAPANGGSSGVDSAKAAATNVAKPSGTTAAKLNGSSSSTSSKEAKPEPQTLAKDKAEESTAKPSSLEASSSETNAVTAAPQSTEAASDASDSPNENLLLIAE